jgi:hypothetical protein
MRSLGFRRAALATGVAAVAAVALAGCSAGQVAETALKKPSVPGVNAQSADGSVLIRNLAVEYDGPTGYAAGDNAPLEVSLFNQTKKAITVLVSSQPATDEPEKAGVVSASSVRLVGGADASPSVTPSATPSARPSATGTADPEASASAEPGAEPSASASAEAALRPARIELPPLGSAVFLPGDAEQLHAVGLTGKLVPGQSVNLVFEFSTGSAPLVVQAPVAVPLTPASRAPGIPHEGTEE